MQVATIPESGQSKTMGASILPDFIDQLILFDDPLFVYAKKRRDIN
jgi:hypothetical protein